MEIETRPGLRLAVAGIETVGGLDAGQPRQYRNQYLLALPAVLLLLLLIVPMVWTFGWALDGDMPLVGNFVTMFTDGAALRSAWHSLLWVGIALALIVVGYVIAVLSRHVGKLWRVLLYVLILPFGASALVSGAVFRLIFDPNPERGMASALFGGATWLGPDWIWWVLASAFSWSWLGFVVVLFRAGLDRSDGSVFRLGRWPLPRPGPVTAIVVLTVLVAAIRVFDLVLVATPASIQDDVDVVGLQWLRMTSRSGDTGVPAALAVSLFIVVALVSAFGMRGSRPPVDDHLAPPSTSDRSSPRWWAWPLVGAVGLLWILPLIVLVATAFHSPEAAGSVGWWHTAGLGLDSFLEAGATWLWPAVAGSLLIAGLATALVLAAAVPAAYLLTWGMPRRVSRVLTAVLAILAVAPVQMYAGPLGDVFGGLGLIGSRAPLALVHAAAGLPFATLVLRTAFLAAPSRRGRPAFDSMWRRGPYRTTVVAVVVLEFVLVWNDFIVAFLISGPGTSPLTLMLWGEARQFGASAGTIAASAVVSALIPVVLLVVTWRKVVVGLTGGIARE